MKKLLRLSFFTLLIAVLVTGCSGMTGSEAGSGEKSGSNGEERKDQPDPQAENTTEEEEEGLSLKNEDWEQENEEHYRNFTVTGSNGQYQISLESTIVPELYYQIIFVTKDGSQPYGTQSMLSHDGDGDKFIPAEFNVSIPSEKLPDRGLVVIKIMAPGDSPGDDLQKVLERREG